MGDYTYVTEGKVVLSPSNSKKFGLIGGIQESNKQEFRTLDMLVRTKTEVTSGSTLWSEKTGHSPRSFRVVNGWVC
jgi:hypothetical protein